ncbi:hypothetical protein [Massilia sp. TSP1-1-2]|uniref:hypothetical protein n=1 Tax=unclassified Massilia TaxID=2609279 RepID=UPI003CF40AB0
MAFTRHWGALALAAALAGCATISESPMQRLEIHTIFDNREITGVGCVITNDAGRWFVTAPGRVSVRRSAGNLFVDCRRGTESVGQERFASRPNASAMIGNVATAGLGYLLDKKTGAGFDYPETLTVLMKASRPAAAAPGTQQGNPGNPVY